MTQQPDLSPKAKSILDQVLEGESPEQQSKILRLVLDMGIKVDEEFFSLALALKHLQLVMLEGPAEWQQKFDEFLDEADVRVESGRQMLAAHSQNVAAIAAIATDVERFDKGIEELSDSIGTLDRQLIAASRALASLLTQWEVALDQWKNPREQESTLNARLLKEVIALRRSLERQQPRAFLFKSGWHGLVVNVIVVYALVITGILIIFLIWSFVN
ncbi:MAG: DUF6753 family protein [Cyanobacteria bacterium P01_D01_bin.156]